jgi:hypothetical protein
MLANHIGNHQVDTPLIDVREPKPIHSGILLSWDDERGRVPVPLEHYRALFVSIFLGKPGEVLHNGCTGISILQDLEAIAPVIGTNGACLLRESKVMMNTQISNTHLRLIFGRQPTINLLAPPSSSPPPSSSSSSIIVSYRRLLFVLTASSSPSSSS